MKDFLIDYCAAVVDMVNMDWFQFVFFAFICVAAVCFIKFVLWSNY
jgi:hypothetical protein